VAEEPQRAPDPFRPGEVPEGRPFAKVGRPGFAVGIFLAIVVLVVVLFVVFGR
jgi:hypothetical protein